jgi:hypothetical protein
MTSERQAVWTVVAVIIAGALLSGPMVAGVDLSPEAEAGAETGPAPGTGTATVEVVTAPEVATLRKGSFGADAPYTLRVPDATIRLSNVTGGPLLVYKLRIRGLGYSRGTTHFLDEAAAGQRSVSLKKTTLDTTPTQEQYQAELLLLLRGDGPERTLYRGTVTVEVGG